jgi:hypothetical protein
MKFSAEESIAIQNAFWNAARRLRENYKPVTSKKEPKQ